MSKQFVKGNVYVFTKKKYLDDKRKNKKLSEQLTKDSLSFWVNSTNGKEVTMIGDSSGEAAGMTVFPEWCKCIKNNNPQN